MLRLKPPLNKLPVMADKNAKKRNVLLGRIGAAHGLAGEVRITSFTDNPLDIADYSPLLTSREGLDLSIVKARLAKNVLIARLAGIDDRDKAESLNGVELFAPRSALGQPDDEDEFLHADLIGLTARLENGEIVGQVIAVPNYGAADLLEIAPSGGASMLIPFTHAVVPEIHVAQGYLIVCPPEEIKGEEGR
ncbi:hypothetical protein MNBD_ALPHA12-205 [hydrothermal vent metagenome]|uniref:Uncharacterized protein n=1 Tax=hydrothermal vent metagenome TaxID=652676 RepID=A0A3B0UMK8_9ZZZZ